MPKSKKKKTKVEPTEPNIETADEEKEEVTVEEIVTYDVKVKDGKGKGGKGKGKKGKGKGKDSELKQKIDDQQTEIQKLRECIEELKNDNDEVNYLNHCVGSIDQSYV